MERDKEEDAYIVDSFAVSGQQRSGETGVEKRRTSRARESVGEDDIRTERRGTRTGSLTLASPLHKLLFL